ncbi:ATP-binding protein [Acinetobacter sp. CIP-A165]|nr:ATP-binding protein [Acinetobacter sp. CIP-A165]
MLDPTLADAILDRIIHNAFKFEITGDWMRKNSSSDVEATLKEWLILK